ncbi:MAG: tRNA epoxyqueuosine(34) reductase QueG [Bacteroidales bacterium]|jgi:epoxyqueuosine reductase|nr:tRNA epoxyqueuosine(34) reductase QueG [Bacteroidales bacterium]
MEQSFSRTIKQKAIEIGFSDCGITDAKSLSAEKETLFSTWLTKGFHAEMHYLERNAEKRFHPQLLFEGTQSIIVVVLNYHNPQYFKEKKSSYLFSQYALGQDYHKVIKDKLNILTHFITAHYPQSRNRCFVDSAPVSEKQLACKAGLGNIGKNSLLQTEKGSYFFIGELFTDIVLEYDSASQKDFCGTCNRCVDACPTNALAEPYCLNAGRCLSYQTIENKSCIPPEIADKTGKHVYGCDICQQVCPNNQKAVATNTEAFRVKAPFIQWTDNDWEHFNEEDFHFYFNNSVLCRLGAEKLRQNIIIASKNTG